MQGDGFRPAPYLKGKHLETIVPSLWPAPAVEGPEEARLVQVSPDAAVRVLVSRPARDVRGTLLLVHGMGGSAESGYMRRSARMAVGHGWIAVRMNLRNCGGTEALSRTLYNAGQSRDAGSVLEYLDSERFPRPFAAAGFSLGGNLVLRYAGATGAEALADAVVGINPPVDLDLCSTALERLENALYRYHFTRMLCREIRAVRAVRPVPGPDLSFWRIRTIRRFDGFFTAPDAGYESAEAYYADASAGPRLHAVRIPAFILSAANDPFVPVEMFDPFRARRPPRMRFYHPERGGHVGYWQAGEPRFWAGQAILEFLDEALG